jgi:hypothetical protein
MEANFALAPFPCNGPVMFARALVWAVAFLIAAGCALVAASQLRLYSGSAMTDTAPKQRVRAMAIGGLVLSAGCCLVIFAQSIPEWFLSGCP